MKYYRSKKRQTSAGKFTARKPGLSILIQKEDALLILAVLIGIFIAGYQVGLRGPM